MYLCINIILSLCHFFCTLFLNTRRLSVVRGWINYIQFFNHEPMIRYNILLQTSGRHYDNIQLDIVFAATTLWYGSRSKLTVGKALSARADTVRRYACVTRFQHWLLETFIRLVHKNTLLIIIIIARVIELCCTRSTWEDKYRKLLFRRFLLCYFFSARIQYPSRPLVFCWDIFNFNNENASIQK